jgi:transcriptional antiterminator
MTPAEKERLALVTSVAEGKISMQLASNQLNLSIRQIRRIIKRVNDEGPEGVIHKLKGRQSNRKYPEDLRQRVITLYETKFSYCGPSLAQQHLHKGHSLRVSRETLRKWLMEANLWQRKRQSQKK